MMLRLPGETLVAALSTMLDQLEAQAYGSNFLQATTTVSALLTVLPTWKHHVWA